ncbi:hypothetical protein ASJ30_13595 [Janibacter indicus]|uniref:Acyl-CoA dehydrogenase n=1 Tax=Janibacter indicus TaxID=857417 RepID=A0A1L3MJG5_9MICO|nr:acyl-CoA dehydrogenase family protein [Janibacter indicus]APH02436.1 hypothetical protein ASJ30_13595 [Janibacter indicus]
MPDLSENDLADLRTALREALQRSSDEGSVRATMSGTTGIDTDLWQTLIADFALPSLAVPEDWGGAGVGWAAQRVVLEELGRSLACVPALSTVGLVLPALVASGDDFARNVIVPSILAGDRLVGAALLGSDPVASCAVSVSGATTSPTLTGRVSHVLDGQVADEILLLGRDEGGDIGLYLVDVTAGGVTREPSATSDLTRRVVSLTFDAAPGRQIGAKDAAPRIMADMRPQALLALACEQSGGAAAVLDQSVAYARQRSQFGRLIGSFQAVKHRLAEVLVALEGCRSATWTTANALDTGDPDVELLGQACATVCAEAYVKAASGNVQVHGGIGYTWEHPAHLHVKRSRGSFALLGTPADHRAAIADLLPLLDQTQTHTHQAHSRVEEGVLR